MNFNISSPGKLLITSEYFVLKGAQALAIPTKFKQSLNFISDESKHYFGKVLIIKITHGLNVNLKLIVLIF